MVKISFVVAVSLNHVIGKDGVVPWRLKSDLQFFSRTTTGHPIVMGRKTFDSIGRLLPNRHSVVVTSSNTIKDKNGVQYQEKPNQLSIVHSVEEAIEFTKTLNKDIYIIGGATIYNETLKYANELLITEVNTILEGGDTFLNLFPNKEQPSVDNIGQSWDVISEEHFNKDSDNEYDFKIITMKKRL